MKKALVELQEKVKLVDLIIEILDARAPFSSRNQYFVNITKDKKRLIILNKTSPKDQLRIISGDAIPILIASKVASAI